MHREDRSSISSHPLADLGRRFGVTSLRAPYPIQFLCSCLKAVPSSGLRLRSGVAAATGGPNSLLTGKITAIATERGVKMPSFLRLQALVGRRSGTSNASPVGGPRRLQPLSSLGTILISWPLMMDGVPGQLGMAPCRTTERHGFSLPHRMHSWMNCLCCSVVQTKSRHLTRTRWPRERAS